MVRDGFVSYICEEVRSPQRSRWPNCRHSFSKYFENVTLKSDKCVCVVCVVFEVDSLQEQENWKEQMITLENGCLI